MEIPSELESRIDEVITHYPVSKRSASLPLLHLIQEHFGYISDDAITWVAQKLELEPINILELVTFYPMFRQEPIGKHHIRVCRTLSCAMAGSYSLLKAFCRHANINPDQHGHNSHVLKSQDGKYSVEFVECLASCGTGPVCMVQDSLLENVEPLNPAAILANYQSPL